MAHRKIDHVVMADMLRRNKSVKEVAERFGVGTVAVYKAKERLKSNVTKNLALENAGRIVNKSLNAVDQLEKINDVTNRLLDELTGEVRLRDHMVSAVEKVLGCGEDENIRDRIRDVIDRVNKDKNTAIKACAEIRNQLKLQLDIFHLLYDMRAVEEFQNEVLDVIGELNPNARDRIVRGLVKKRVIRGAISWA